MNAADEERDHCSEADHRAQVKYKQAEVTVVTQVKRGDPMPTHAWVGARTHGAMCTCEVML